MTNAPQDFSLAPRRRAILLALILGLHIVLSVAGVVCITQATPLVHAVRVIADRLNRVDAARLSVETAWRLAASGTLDGAAAPHALETAVQTLRTLATDETNPPRHQRVQALLPLLAQFHDALADPTQRETAGALLGSALASVRAAYAQDLLDVETLAPTTISRLVVLWVSLAVVIVVLDMVLIFLALRLSLAERT